MIRYFISCSLILSLLITGCKTTRDNKTESAKARIHLDSLYGNHQFFQLRREFEVQKDLLSRKDAMLIEAKLFSVFNQRESSNELIAEIFSSHSQKLSESEKKELLETKIINDVFLFNYREALRDTEKVLTSHAVSEESKEDHENTLIIYRSLKDAAQQKIQLKRSELPITQDMAGLLRIPVRINAIEEKVVFDTGANFSVITDSLALEAGIKILGEPFKVKAITGAEVDSRVGVADLLKIGSTELKNVVFLVFPEESLSFPSIGYTIGAILGFPVINALKEIKIVEREEFIITGNRSEPEIQNLALDFLTPIVEVFEKGKSLTFTFDTGANSTSLYEDYYFLRKNEILENAVLDSLEFGGAGGTLKIPVYKSSFSGRIGNSPFTLNSVSVYKENVRDTPGIYGNLGQDVFSQYDTLQINFEEMAFLLK